MQTSLRTTSNVLRAQRVSVSRGSRSLRMCVCAAQKPTVIINSSAGKMGHAAAEAAWRAGCEIVPFTVCADWEAEAIPEVTVGDVTVKTVGASAKDALFDDLAKSHENMMVIDFTLPAAVNANADFYNARGLPYVMGTTGGDRVKLVEDTKAAGTYAVIAPQMGKQVVAFQAMMELMAKKFPGAFAGYKLEVLESHQATKEDTSGTAKAVVQSFIDLGVLPFDLSEIQMKRGMEASTAFGVPEEYVEIGHGWHTYKLTSPDGTVAFEFQHNVNGRQIYAEGTVDAALFLQGQIEKGADQKVYNMIDVLEAGGMRD